MWVQGKMTGEGNYRHASGEEYTGQVGHLEPFIPLPVLFVARNLFLTQLIRAHH